MSRVLDGGAAAAAFPLGGIGTGNVSVGARGELRDWELANAPDKGASLPFTFFAIRVAGEDREAVTRVLEGRLRPPHEGDQGYDAGKLAGLPRLAGSAMRGEYPLLRVELGDPVLGVEVALSAFTPFVPLDADASGLPGAVLRYTVKNTSAEAADVTVVGSMANPVGIVRRNVFNFPEFEGHPRNEWVDDGLVRGIRFGTDLDEGDLRFGSAALSTTDADVTAKPQWLSGFWQDGVQVFWDDLRADGRLDVEDVESLDPPPHPQWFTRLRVGSLGIVARLEPGAERDFEFLLTWHFPNRARAWQGNIGLDNAGAGEVVRNHYATRFADAWAVARHLAAELPALEGATRAFHRALHGGTLPAEVVDAAAANLAALRSTTCFRLEGGVFAAWEGSFDHAGSCEGTCTHVWNYAQSMAFLFPELERSARTTEFLHETREDGRMNFRANSVFGNAAWDFHPAVDGQLGAVVRLYREWRFGGGDEWLARLFPGAKRALDFAFTEWDADGDGVLDSKQHNTYDIEFFGPNSLANSMFVAALHAAARMAAHLGEDAVAERYRAAATHCAERMDALLYNGEYYEQRLDRPNANDVVEHRYQYGRGCLSDQLLGQQLAHIVGLGHVLPADHVRSAIGAVSRYNFREDLSEHHSVQRTYALGDEAGLLLCTWPHGGRPRIPFVYCDEVWTGIEYQVATHLIYEGLVEEGLRIVRAVRERHDGRRRSPWNEAECGNHYARSLASWGPVLALSGVDYDAPSATLTVRPRLDATVMRSVFTTGRGWGEVEVGPGGAALALHGGSLDLARLVVEHPSLGRLEATGVSLRAGDAFPLTAPAPTTAPEEK